MSDSIHGHEVLRMMLASGTAYTKANLREEIVRRFGPHARFHTCSAQNLTADELIEFLEQRSKFQKTGDALLPDAARICADG
jgi:probable metal-binding protein